MNEGSFRPLPTSAGDVPVFNCIVYVQNTGSEVKARVANLAGIEAVAGSEREALGKVVPAFKSLVAKLTEQGDEISWIDPVPPPAEGELVRYVPVHL